MIERPNAQRGETSIVIDGQLYQLRPTFTALVAAEEELGSLYAIVDRAAEGAITLTEIATLLWHCLPNQERPSRESVGEAVIGMGLLEATKPMRKILSQVLQGCA
ncbi:hypothetical protein BPTFM16_01954 [Altererythrobacter insulae]|nr:hypothetical protein BPTFM16_01954 [Altererythrobacter insulae]